MKPGAFVLKHSSGAYYVGLANGAASFHQGDAKRYPTREEAIAVRRVWPERSQWSALRLHVAATVAADAPAATVERSIGDALSAFQRDDLLAALRSANDRIVELERTLARFREALEFFGDETSYGEGVIEGPAGRKGQPRSPFSLALVARAALEGVPDGSILRSEVPT